MAFLAPLIVGALGLTGTAGALATLGLGVGLQFAANKLKPKQKSQGGFSGAQVGLKIDTNPSRTFVAGERLVGGSLVFWHLSGTNNEKLWMVIALADHRCDSLQGVVVAKQLRSWNSGTGVVDTYGDNLKVRFYRGEATQTADAALVSASGGRWLSTARGDNVCYAVVEATYDEKLFPEGIPELGFKIRGADFLIDPRTGSPGYSDNVAVIIYNLLRGITVGGQKLIGMTVPAGAIRLAEAQAACNACDENVALAGGGTEKRYRCGVELECSMDNQDILETVISAFAGEVIEVGGIYRIFAGVGRTPVAHLTDADLIPAQTLRTKFKRPRNRLVNAVFGSYSDPARLYSDIPLPPRISSDDEEEDGGERWPLTLDLSAVTSRSQGQRIMEIERRKARRMGSEDMQLRAARFVLEPGDWVTWTSDRRGYVDKTFVLESSAGSRDLRSDIVLGEMDEGFDDWDTSLEIADDQVIDLPPAGPTLSSVSITGLANAAYSGSGSQQRPALTLTWVPITDPTVQSLALEFRKVGDTVAIEGLILTPSTGSYTWPDGVQGEVQYEARARPITRPERFTSWSSWVQASGPGTQLVVGVAAVAEIAENIADDTVTFAKLSLQERMMLERTFAGAEVQGSIANQLQEFYQELQDLGEAVQNNHLVAGDSYARVRTETRERLSLTEAFAQYKIITEAVLAEKASSTAVLDLTSRVTTTESGLTSASARIFAGVTIQSGYAKVTAGVDIYGNESGSGIMLLSDKFVVAKPDGSNIKQLITTGVVDGVSDQTVLNTDLVLPDGTIRARHLSVESIEAVEAQIEDLEAVYIHSADNSTYIDFDTGDFQFGG